MLLGPPWLPVFGPADAPEPLAPERFTEYDYSSWTKTRPSCLTAPRNATASGCTCSRRSHRPRRHQGQTKSKPLHPSADNGPGFRYAQKCAEEAEKGDPTDLQSTARRRNRHSSQPEQKLLQKTCCLTWQQTASRWCAKGLHIRRKGHAVG